MRGREMSTGLLIRKAGCCVLFGFVALVFSMLFLLIIFLSQRIKLKQKDLM